MTERTVSSDQLFSGLCCKPREVLVDKSHHKSRERASLEKIDRPSPYPPRHIYFCHEWTTMTSETSEKTAFVRFYFTLCYITLTIKCYTKSSFSRDYNEGDFFKEILWTLQEICREIAFNKNSLKGTDLRFIESLPTQNVDHTA